MAKLSYSQAIRETIAQEMRRDERVFVMGEDVEKLGGVYGCTRDLYKKFGTERIRNTPISESAIIGSALGAACTGMRPIAELMYWDFAFVAADQIFNQVAKTRYVFGGNAKIPLVIRGQQGTGRGNAATHSQSLESIFMHIPGLKVVCPSTPADAAGLLRTAIRDDNPVCFFEHKVLYASKGEVPDDPDFCIPFGKADIKREGTDVTIVANLLYVKRALEAADELARGGISAEVIDPRTLVPFDYDTVAESVKKTGRLVVVHEAHQNNGWGAQVVSQVSQMVFPYLDAAPVHIGAKACPLPFNLGLEQAVLPSVKDIVDACKAAKARGLTISCDLNFRKKLWTSQRAGEVMSQLLPYVDVCIANEEDAKDVFGIEAEGTDINSGKLNRDGYISVARQLSSRFGCKYVAITLRSSISANDNDWAGMLYEAAADKAYFSTTYHVHIVDRVGGGDSFGGGLIYSMLSGYDAQQTIDFAVAASCLKHSIEHDFNHVSVAEVAALAAGNASGRVQR